MLHTLFVLFALLSSVNGFQVAQRQSLGIRQVRMPRYSQKWALTPQHRASTELSMYNLPPSGGGKNDFKDLALSALTLLGVVAFFASPLGGLFFFAFNSLFLLLLFVPIAGIISFNVWQYLNTVEGPCPNCGASTRVVKNEGVQPTPGLCVNCGAFVTANTANDGVEIFRGENAGVVGEEPSIFDGLFGGGGGIGDMFDSATSTTTTKATETRAEKFRRDQTIIDADVIEDPKDKPFQ